MCDSDAAKRFADKPPDFAVVWSFFHKFGKKLELENISIQDVHDWITTKCSESSITVDVMVKLMRKTGMRVDKQRWQKFLLKAAVKQDAQLAMDLGASGFDGLSFSKKLRILKLLCEMQFDENIKFKTLINGENPEEQRLKPIGKNEDGCLYWYQQDEELNIRIYIEDQDDDDDETGWTVACRTKEEFQGLIKRLCNDSTEEKKDNSDTEDENVVETKFQKFLKSQCHADTDVDDDSNGQQEGVSKEELGHGDSDVSKLQKGNEPTIKCNTEAENIIEHDAKTAPLLVQHHVPLDPQQSTAENGNVKSNCGETGDVITVNKISSNIVKDNLLVDKIKEESGSYISSESQLEQRNSNQKVKCEDLCSESGTTRDELEDKKCSTELSDVYLHDSAKFEICEDKSTIEKSDVSESDVNDAKMANELHLNETEIPVKSELANNTLPDKIQTVCTVKDGQVSTPTMPESDKSGDLMQLSTSTDNDQHKPESSHLPETNTAKEENMESPIKSESGIVNSSKPETLEEVCTNGITTDDPGDSIGSEQILDDEQANMKTISEQDESMKDGGAPKKKRRRRRAAASRRRTRTNNQKSDPKSTTPKQRNKPKLSRIALLQKEAESIILKEKDDNESKKDAVYTTRSGRRVKSTQHDPNETDVWQSIPDEMKTGNDEVRDKDFQYNESKSRGTAKSDVEVTPKKPRRSRKNDLPCEKCGLFSHPTTILLCDCCNKGHHMACLTPPLMAVPEDDWFCPKCCKEKLIANLKQIYEDLETKIKLSDRKTRQTERNKALREYTGISATNIISERPKPHKPIKRKKSYSSNSEDEFVESDFISEPSSPELKSVRSCRTKKVSYDFSSFDKTIRDAIGEVDEPDSSDEKPVSGKDIRTIVAAQKGEDVAKKLFRQDSAAGRKKRKLTDLNCSEDEAAESGSNYSVSSSEGEVSEDEFAGSEDLDSDGSFKVGLRRSRRKKMRAETKPIKRSRRLRRKRIQEDYASSISDSSTEYEDVPKKKKRGIQRKDSSEDEYRPPSVVKAPNFIDDDDNDVAEVNVETKKKSRVLHSSSEDESKAHEEATKDVKTATPVKQDDDLSSDDWSSLSSNAEESFEEASADENVP